MTCHKGWGKSETRTHIRHSNLQNSTNRLPRRATLESCCVWAVSTKEMLSGPNTQRIELCFCICVAISVVAMKLSVFVHNNKFFDTRDVQVGGLHAVALVRGRVGARVWQLAV